MISSLLELFISWLAKSFRIGFGKILVAFNFDEKLTQSIAQVTMQYHVSKDFLHLQFVVDQVFQFQDMENGRMLSEQKLN